MTVLIIKEFADLATYQDLESATEIWLIADPVFGPQYGVRYYMTMRSKVRELLPKTKVFMGICCNDLPGYAMEAIAASVDRLLFKKSSPYWNKIESLCINGDIDIQDQDKFLTNVQN